MKESKAIAGQEVFASQSEIEMFTRGCAHRGQQAGPTTTDETEEPSARRPTSWPHRINDFRVARAQGKNYMHKTQSLINCLICSETCKAAACPRHTPFSPHLCVGFLFLILYPAPPPCPPPFPPPRCHTDNFVTHHLSHTTLSHTSLSHNIFHTQLCHTPLCHTPSFTNNFVTHLFVTHLFSLSHTIFHTQLRHTPLCHTPSFTHSFDTALSHTTFHKPLCHTHTILSHTIFHIPLSLCHTQLCHTPSLHGRPGHTPSLRGRRGTWRHPPALCVAGVARMALGWVWWRAWGPLVARRATTLCVAGHSATCTYVLRGRRGAYGTGLGLAPFGCVACFTQAWFKACFAMFYCKACFSDVLRHCCIYGWRHVFSHVLQAILACLTKAWCKACFAMCYCKPCFRHGGKAWQWVVPCP